MAGKAKGAILAAAALLLLVGVGAWVLGPAASAPPSVLGGDEVAAAARPPVAPSPPSPAAIPPVSPAAPTAAAPPDAKPAEAADPAEAKADEVLVEGVVVDADGLPFAGADVVVAWQGLGTPAEGRPRLVSGEDGSFRTTVAAGRVLHWIAAEAPGLVPSPFVVVDDPPGTKRTVRLVLGAVEGVLEGVVLSPSGDPVAGAEVQVGDAEGFLPNAIRTRRRNWSAATTDDLGRFRIGLLPAGPLQILARGEGFPPAWDSAAIESGRTTRKEIRLRPPGILVGTVRDAEGRTVAGMAVMAVSFAGCPVGAKTDADGNYRIADLFDGKNEIRVDGKVRGKAEAFVETPAGVETRCDLRLSIAEVIRGRVLDAEGEPLTGWWVAARAKEWAFAGMGAVLESEVDGKGGFLLHSLAAGDYDLLVRPEKYGVPSLVQKGVRAGGEAIEIRVPASALPTAGIRGVLLGPDRKPLRQAWLSLHPEIALLQSVASARPDPETGAFDKQGLPPGRYRLEPGSKTAGGRDLGIVELVPGKTLDLGEVVFDPPGRIVVLLVAEGERPSGKQVILSIHRREPDGSWFPAGSPRPGADGTVPEVLLGAGEYRIRVWGNDVQAAEAFFQARSGQETRVELPCRRAPQRFLRVHGPGLPKEAAFVHSRIVDGTGILVQEVNWGRAKGHGEILGYAFLLPGAYELELTPEGGEPVRRRLSIAAEDGTKYESAIDVELR